jgi:hypothetical protein
MKFPKLLPSLKTLKEVFDVVAHLHTIGKLGELVPEGIKKRIEERWEHDYRPEVWALIYELHPHERVNLIRRLTEGQANGTEDTICWALGRIPENIRKDAFIWLNRASDQEFNAMINILVDDKVNQFLIRAKNTIAKYGGMALHAATVAARWVGTKLEAASARLHTGVLANLKARTARWKGAVR